MTGVTDIYIEALLKNLRGSWVTSPDLNAKFSGCNPIHSTVSELYLTRCSTKSENINFKINVLKLLKVVGICEIMGKKYCIQFVNPFYTSSNFSFSPI